MSCADWINMGNAVADSLKCNKAKTLRISNDRESFQFKKISHYLESMKSLNDNLRKQEERKIKKKLENLTAVSNVSKSGLYNNIYKKPNSFVLSENQQEDTWQYFEKAPNRTSAALSSDHLPKIFSLLHQPVRHISSPDKKNNNDHVALSGMDITVDTNTPRLQHGIKLRSSNLLKISGLHNGKSTSRWLGLELSHISIPEPDVMFPLQHKLSRDKFQYKSVSTDSTFEKRQQRELFFKAWQDKCKKPLTSCIPPEDVLRCRYLRLSERNIASLLQRCKESGIHVDIHPHMKESDIDISTIMSSENINTVSL